MIRDWPEPKLPAEALETSRDESDASDVEPDYVTCFDNQEKLSGNESEEPVSGGSGHEEEPPRYQSSEENDDQPPRYQSSEDDNDEPPRYQGPPYDINRMSISDNYPVYVDPIELFFPGGTKHKKHHHKIKPKGKESDMKRRPTPKIPHHHSPRSSPQSSPHVPKRKGHRVHTMYPE